MSQFPDTLEKSALLQLAATCIASGHPLDRIVLMAIWPLGKLQNTVLDLQDHFEALIYIFGGGRPVPWHGLRTVNPRKAPMDEGQQAVTTQIARRNSLGQGCGVSRTDRGCQRVDRM